MIRRIGALIVTSLLAGTAYADCLDDAAVFHGVSPPLLRSIAIQESGMRPWVTNRNTNGSEDIGLLQINSIHLPRLSKYGITRAHLFDGCVNAYVGAWILRENIQRFGPTWKAVGAYNAASPDKQLRYANQIHARWQALQRAALR
ncbi:MULTISPECIES: lytic transglycosylase domain-containing protein [Cupriavidus]|jgi:soluble lytic murein transglycosylase-like protein|uniref:Lytic transglycosylase domain-containing protein n=1 Tax=Cupriavidus basilensis TaxID=68895 RepID=A0A7M2H9M8_9BURK|nr:MULTISPECIES: lytic transglycosylase domain-containing protein [Cupriavidus]KUE86427.1 lytic transglycosylase [Cupriavidus necator]QOT81701.1 lytic transglycosylase domain-containing protein [Cupriavidus basilensis]BDB30082.1 lytic transglycosylase domain-containing protein [Cupriavidus sp. P-10]